MQGFTLQVHELSDKFMEKILNSCVLVCIAVQIKE